MKKQKKNANAQYGSLFSGSYEEYKQNLSTFTSEFKASGFTSVNENYYNNTVNGESVKAYIECIKSNSKDPFRIWVVSETDNKITIGVKNGYSGNTKLKVETFDENCIGKQSDEITSGSETSFTFKKNKYEDFSVNFKGTETTTLAAYIGNITIPKKRNIIVEKTTKELLGTLECRAGGFGDVRGNRYVRNFTFVADNGYSILPNSLKLIEEIKGGIGVNSYTFAEPKLTIENNKVVKLILEFLDVVGNDKDQQGGATLRFKVMQEKIKFVEN